MTTLLRATLLSFVLCATPGAFAEVVDGCVSDLFTPPGGDPPGVRQRADFCGTLDTTQPLEGWGTLVLDGTYTGAGRHGALYAEVTVTGDGLVLIEGGCGPRDEPCPPEPIVGPIDLPWPYCLRCPVCPLSLSCPRLALLP